MTGNEIPGISNPPIGGFFMEIHSSQVVGENKFSG